MKTILSCFFLTVVLASCSAQKLTSREKQNLLSKFYADSVISRSHVGIYVVDADQGSVLVSEQSDKYFVPASNTKLPTCFAALKYLGDSLEIFRYLTVMDTLFLAPSANPAFLHPDFDSKEILSFLRGFKKIVICQSPFSDYLGNGWSWNDYQDDYMAQKNPFPLYGNLAQFSLMSAGNVQVRPETFRDSTQFMERISKGVSVERNWDTNRFEVREGSARKVSIPFRPDLSTIARLLEDTVHAMVDMRDGLPSEPTGRMNLGATDSLLSIMMHRSDNFFAEQVLLMVSNRVLGKMDDNAIIRHLLSTDLSTLPQAPRWADGSGLSRYNLFSPQDFVSILKQMRQQFGMERLQKILATGNTGTLQNYYRAESGNLFAKTGTLSGAVALSGFVKSASGRQLIFSILVNNNQGSATQVRRAVESFLESLIHSY